MFRRVPLSIIRSFSLYTQQRYMSYRFADSLRAGSGWNRFGSAVGGVQQQNQTGSVLILADSKPVWHIRLLCLQWKTADDRQSNCPKHVEFYSKNKFENLGHVVAFIVSSFESIILILVTKHRNFAWDTQVKQRSKLRFVLVCYNHVTTLKNSLSKRREPFSQRHGVTSHNTQLLTPNTAYTKYRISSCYSRW